MCGAVIFTTLADRFGRKLIYVVCQFSMLVLGVVIAFVPNYISYAVLRFFLGAVREVRDYRLLQLVCSTAPVHTGREYGASTRPVFTSSVNRRPRPRPACTKLWGLARMNGTV